MLNKFKSDTAGSMTTFVALGASFILMVVGAAIEISVLTKSIDSLQDAADSAALAAAVSTETDDSKLLEIAQAAAEANYAGSFTLSLAKDDEETLIEVSSNHEMLLMGIFGYDTRPISVKAGSIAGTGGKLSIALALDTTLSMEGQRMSNMISAASDLVDKVEEADKGLGNAKIAVIPFADYVRIDMGFADEDWIDVQPDQEVTWKTLDEENSVNCREEGSGELAQTVCDSYVYETRTAVASWNGCMVSRPDGLHKSAAYDGQPFMGNAGHTSCNWKNNIASPLSRDFEEVKADIEALTARGKTYIPVGLLWAWRALEEEQLFTDENLEEDAETQRVLLLMTDGSNTARLNDEGKYDDWDGIFHWGSSNEDANQVVADELTLELCTSIKTAGIRLITVAYEVDDDDTKQMLSSCASTGADYHDATSAATLAKAFGKIGTAFKQTRLTL